MMTSGGPSAAEAQTGQFDEAEDDDPIEYIGGGPGLDALLHQEAYGGNQLRGEFREPGLPETPKAEDLADKTESRTGSPSLRPEDHLESISEKFGIEISNLVVKFDTAEFGRFDVTTGKLYHKTADGKEVDASELFGKSAASGEEKSQFETRLGELAREGISYDQNVLSKDEVEIIAHMVVDGIYYTAAFTARVLHKAEYEAVPRSLEPLAEQDDGDDIEPVPVIGAGANVFSFSTTLNAENAQGIRAEVYAIKTSQDASGLEPQYLNQGSGKDVEPITQTEVSITPDVNLLVSENSPALEQSSDFTPSLEVDDFDDEAQRVEISRTDKKTADTVAIVREPEFIEQLPELPTPEIPVARQGQAELTGSAQIEIAAMEILPEGIVLVEDLPGGDDGFEPSADNTETQKTQSENKTVIAPVEAPVNTAPVAETSEKTGGIELVDINNHGPDLEEAVMNEAILAQAPDPRQQERQESPEPIEITGMASLDGSEIQATESSPEILELKPDIVKAEEILNPAAVAEIILSAEDILKPEIMEQDRLGIEIEETLQIAESAGIEPLEVILEATRISDLPALAAKAEFQKPDIRAAEVIEPVAEIDGIALVEARDVEIDRVAQGDYEPVAAERAEADNSVKETASGIEIVTAQPNDLAEKTNKNNRAANVHQPRPRPVIEAVRQPIQIETVRARTVVPKPEVRKIVENAAKSPTRILEAKSKAQSLTRQAARAAESKAAKNTAAAKSSRAPEIKPGLEKITPKLNAREPANLRQQVRTVPIIRARQDFNPAGIRASSIKVNQRTLQPVTKLRDAKPTVIKFPQKAPLPFRSGEFISKTLTFKPAAAGDDEAASNNVESYLPEFELAA